MSRLSRMLRGVLLVAVLASASSAWAQNYAYVHATYLLNSVKVCTNAGCTWETGSQATNHAAAGGFPQAVFEYCLNFSGNFYQCSPDSYAIDLVFKWTDVNSTSWENRYSAGSMYPYPYPTMQYYYGTNGYPASSGISIGNNQLHNGVYGYMWMGCSEQDAYTWTCYYGTGGPGWFWSINYYYSWQYNNWYPWI